MLTKQQRVYHWIRPGRLISSDRLEDDCLPHLARGIAVYRRMIDRQRGHVRNAARAAMSALRPDRVEALIVLLDEAATYEWPRGSRQAEVRLRLFEAAAAEHPVLDPERARALLDPERARALPDSGQARALPDSGQARPLLDGARSRAASAAPPASFLYADYPEHHRLSAFPDDLTPEALRDDYDLSQAQALLYDAIRVTVEATGDLKHIVRYARLARLLHRIERLRGGGYRLVFDGPNSVLRHTRAYGVDFARFLAALVQARGWIMKAEIVLRRDWRPLTFALSDADGLRSRLPAPSLFDSSLEETFAGKFGPRRGGWRLEREAAILDAGEALVVPDFVFTHDDGTGVAMEIVGYWTPEYLAEKVAKYARVRDVNLIVAVRKELAVRAGELPADVLVFKSGILLRDLMPRLERFRQGADRTASGRPRRQSDRTASV
jgi:predicted nuclease of restriction endonuclease-like RecB superfamily